MEQVNEFARKLKQYRKAHTMSQKDFASFLGMPYRTYQNYESDTRYPKNMAVVNKIAFALGTNVEELLGAEGGYIVEAGEKGSSKDRRRMEQLVIQLSALFAGGNIDEESKDAAIDALRDAYWQYRLL